MSRIGLLIGLLLLGVWAIAGAGKHEAPPHRMIELAYFKCDASRNLEGGIYGKGPFKRFGPEQSACSSSEWASIKREEFKRLAAEWYGYDWNKEIPFWNQKE
jgi:hypothetical protein